MLPDKVVVGASEWRIQESEGLYIFIQNTGFADIPEKKLVFTRCDSNLWYVETMTGPVYVGDIIGCYRILEEEYSGPFGGHMDHNGRACGPYDHSKMPYNR